MMKLPRPIFVLTVFILLQSACKNQISIRAADASVLDHYQKIQQALMSDTVREISENATAIAKAVKEDGEKKLPIAISEQAEKLARAKDLAAARENFKGLSAAVISYLEKQNLKGTGYVENYCPMASASWLEKGKKINNPYFGKSMPTCGENKKTF